MFCIDIVKVEQEISRPKPTPRASQRKKPLLPQSATPASKPEAPASRHEDGAKPNTQRRKPPTAPRRVSKKEKTSTEQETSGSERNTPDLGASQPSAVQRKTPDDASKAAEELGFALIDASEATNAAAGDTEVT